MYFTVVYLALNILGTNYLLALDEQSHILRNTRFLANCKLQVPAVFRFYIIFLNSASFGFLCPQRLILVHPEKC